MRIAIYIVWGLLTLFFFGLALFGKLEQMSGKGKHERPGDLFKQGLFVAFCVAISVVIDQNFLEGLVNGISPDWIPYPFYQVMLLPVVLYVAAKIIGPTKTIAISKAPDAEAARRKHRGGK